jgi:hypothetical protein
MTKGKSIFFAGLLLLVVCGGAVWLALDPGDPLARGRPESYWIEHLSYGDGEQVKRWRDFGPEGVHVLVRALDKANRPADRFYRRAHRYLGGWMPNAVMDPLPAPRMDSTRGTRMNLVALLSRLSKIPKQRRKSKAPLGHRISWLSATLPNALFFDLLEARTYRELLASPDRLANRIPSKHRDWFGNLTRSRVRFETKPGNRPGRLREQPLDRGEVIPLVCLDRFVDLLSETPSRSSPQPAPKAAAIPSERRLPQMRRSLCARVPRRVLRHRRCAVRRQARLFSSVRSPLFCYFRPRSWWPRHERDPERSEGRVEWLQTQDSGLFQKTAPIFQPRPG